MIEELLPDLYRIEIPLPRSPLKYLNSYVIKGDRNLLVDTGMNRPECFEAMTAGLKELGVSPDKTDIFITHLHADHSGQCGIFAGHDSKVYMSEMESRMTQSGPNRREFLYGFLLASGFPKGELDKAMAAHPATRYGMNQQVAFTPVRDGDIMTAGDYSLKCVATPGHTPQHMCLYDAAKKLLIAGDHILIDITPNIIYWPEMENALQNYLDSLDKIFPFEVKLTLPGHRRIVADHRARIMELHEHHDNRAAEALEALKAGPLSPWQVAPLITWDMVYDKWENVAPQQKWFAVGETIAHLIYLEGLGKVRRSKTDGQIMFSLI